MTRAAARLSIQFRNVEYPMPNSSTRLKWLGLLVMLSAPFLGSLDFNIVNVSVPAIQAGIGASFAQIQLIVAGYGLAYAVALITGGRLGDIYGRRRLFTIGMTCFAISSALCGSARSPHFLITSRILQGFSAALMFPQALSYIQVAFSEEERALAFGIFGVTLGLGSLAGNIFSGVLERLNLWGLTWRPIFLVNLPVAVAALLLARLWVTESRAENCQRLDLPGVGLVSAALFFLVYPLAIGREAHWPRWSILMLGASAVFLVLFFLFERMKSRRQDSPLVPLELFRHKNFSAGLCVAFAFFGGLAAILLVTTIFMQLSLRMPPLETGLLFCPYAGAFLIASLASARIGPRLGRMIVQVGTILMLIGMRLLIFYVARHGIYTLPWHIGLSLACYGFGQGLAQPPLVNLILSGIGNEEAGSAAGVLATVQQVAYAIGVAGIGSAFSAFVGDRPLPWRYAEAFSHSLLINCVLAATTFFLVFLLPKTTADPVANVQEQP